MEENPLLGKVLSGRYRLVRSIAKGGMGEVFEARDERSPGDRVALKLLREDFSRDPDWCARFKREAEVAAAIHSPHVARVLDLGKTHTGRRWIAFELLEGESLDTRLERERILPFSDVTWMVEHMLLALEAAHAVGVVHRDMKPANLFIVQARGRLWLCVLDFGIAKRVRHGKASSGLTGLEMTLGTPSYMSPEQFVNARDVDARTDLFSVGSVVWRALTGHVPFGSRDVGAMFSRKRKGDLPSVQPEALDGWLRHMIASRREDRFDTARAALTAWRHVVAALPADVQVSIAEEYVREDTDIAPITEVSGTRDVEHPDPTMHDPAGSPAKSRGGSRGGPRGDS